VLSSSAPGATAAPRRPGLVVIALHAATFTGLLIWSWRKWPDPLVDFGRELYVPWQLDNGRMLYRDIASLFGPLSPYINLLWFRLFGVSLLTLALVNTALLAALTAGIYDVIRAATDRVTATAATLTAVLLFGFSQYLDVGNYNYITPYSHEATHGMVLSVASMLAWRAAVARRTRRAAALSGFCAGLVVLTKPEIAVALAAAMMIGIAISVRLEDEDGVTMKLSGTFAAFVIVPAACFFLYFHLAGPMTLYEAVRSVVAGWIPAIFTPVARNAFYAKVTGFDKPAGHFWQMLVTFAGFIAFVAMAVALGQLRPQQRVARMAWLAVQIIYLLTVAFVVPYFELSRAFPLIVASGLAGTLLSCSRSEQRGGDAAPAVLLLMWCTFALALLGKMLLNARIYHYGFYLAWPAATVTVILLVWSVPRAVAAGRGDTVAGHVRWLLAAAVAVAIAPHLALTQTWFATKTVVVGSGRDRFLASGGRFWQGQAVRDAVSWLEHETSSSATVAVIPEGIMINYLARRTTPVRFVNYMPPEMTAFGEPEMLRAFAEHPPDYVLFVDRDTSEYGFAAFGSDPRYGAALLSWIRTRYEAVTRIGPGPSEKSKGSIEILKRRLTPG
jgi:hypothetical protein